MFEKLSEVIKAHIAELYVGVVCATLAGLFYLFADLVAPLFPMLFENISSQLLWRITIFQLMIFLLLIPCFIILLNKIKDPYKFYNFDDKTGVLKNIKDGHFYCLSCFQNNIKSPMKITKNGWQCLNKNCNKFYEKEGYVRQIGCSINHNINNLTKGVF